MNYLSCYVLQKRHTGGIAFLLAFACLGAVGWIMFVVTAKNMAANLKGLHLDLYGLALFVVCTGAAIAFYYAKRVHILIDDDENNTMAIYIKDRAFPAPLAIQHPYSLSKQWSHEYGPRRIKMKRLFVTILGPQGEPLVTFTSQKGALMDSPNGFDYLDLIHGNDREKRVQAPERTYETSKTEDIAYTVEDYLQNFAKWQRPAK